MPIPFGPRRAIFTDVAQAKHSTLSAEEVEHFEKFDLIYRSLCALLYNYAPTSGHPGGSISSGRFVAAALFDAMDYDVRDPDRPDADVISYGAGHKALGLYAMWALRNEIVRMGAPDLLPEDERKQLRLEDLLGFRRNPTTSTPLFRHHRVKALDGHPTPATPFVRLATGASGVGVGSSLGLALAAADLYGDRAPRVHVVEGEGGLTPGRVAEALAFAGTASLGNAIMHVDWNQASIDSDHVTREDDVPGDYVQWDPRELFYLHDWNVIYVPDGTSISEVVGAQRYALSLENGQPTAIVYGTVKGWQYGIEGRASHGAGHKLCSTAFFQALFPLTKEVDAALPMCEAGDSRCAMGADPVVVEACFWDALLVIRRALEKNEPMVNALAARLRSSIERLDGHKRLLRVGAPNVGKVFELARAAEMPKELELEPWSTTTLRAQLGRTIGWFNRESDGAFMIGSADLLGSTSILDGAKGFPTGYYNMKSNPGSRIISAGGICEDGLSAILSGLSTWGGQIGVGSSYGAFIAPLGHIAARLHSIGNQARHSVSTDPYKPFILICGHAGLKTGEDGPTHADPQPLQLFQENFPPGTMITLTPWDPNEVFPLMSAALAMRPAVIAPFVTRPNEVIVDRSVLGLAPASDAIKGVYRLRKALGSPDGTIVLQESGVTYAFVQETMKLLEDAGIDLDVYYVSSTELYDILTLEERDEIFPEEKAMDAMGITGFTMPTMYRWIRSDFGRRHTLYPYLQGHFLGSGAGRIVIAEAGLDGEGQFRAIRRYLDERSSRSRVSFSEGSESRAEA